MNWNGSKGIKTPFLVLIHVQEVGLLTDDGIIPRFGCHRPEIDRGKGLSKPEILHASIDHRIVRTATTARPQRVSVAVLAQLSDIVELVEVHVKMERKIVLLTEETRRRRFGNVRITNAEEIGSGGPKPGPLFRWHDFLEVIIPAVNKIAASGELGRMGLRRTEAGSGRGSSRVARATENCDVCGLGAGKKKGKKDSRPTIRLHPRNEASLVVIDVKSHGHAELPFIAHA